MLDDEQIERVFAEHARSRGCGAETLVRAANRGGGDDNITVVCFRSSETAEDTSETAAMDLPTDENALPDEDTLSGLDGQRLPTDGGDTMVVPPAADDASAERPGAGRLLLLVGLLAGLAAALLYLLDVF